MISVLSGGVEVVRATDQTAANADHISVSLRNIPILGWSTYGP